MEPIAMLESKNPPKESEKQIESVDKALTILECFSDRTTELSLKELSEKTGLYKSRILRLCGTLMAHGFLIRLNGSAYRLGPKLLMLGKAYERANTLISISRPILRELTSLTGESAKLFVIEGTKRLCLVREEGPYPLRYAIREGETFDLHAGASGKVLLAFSSEAFCNEVLKKSLKRMTPTTIVDRDRLEKELEAVRLRGYASSIGEVVPEVAGISAPVFDHTDSIIAALTVAGPIQRFAGERFQDMCRHIKASAQKLSHLLGHAADYPAAASNS
jgi:DNA-binding IclR family transcriptional regulator